MRPDLAILRNLLARLETAAGPLDSETACRLHALGAGRFMHYLNSTVADGGGVEHVYEVDAAWRIRRVEERDLPDRSLDAAVALMERVLPGWSFLMAWNGQRSIANVHVAPLGTNQLWARAGEGSTPALALCTALVRALIARAETEADRGD